MGSTGEQPTSELVAGLLDTARASRTRTMQEVAGAWQRAGTITRNLILMASSETGSIERPATNLVTQLHMYILVARPGGRDVAVATSLLSRRWHSSRAGRVVDRARPQHHERLRRRSGRDRLAVAGRPSGVRGRPGRYQTHRSTRSAGLNSGCRLW